MPNTPMTIKVPGKLMIAGEFAVLEPHQNLVVTAVDRFVYTTLTSSGNNQITLRDFNLHDLNWEYKHGEVKIESDDHRVAFVESAMTIAFNYMEEMGVKADSFALTIKSELDDASGIKYGLGSSAAVVTAVITAILKKYLPHEPTAGLIFKLAAISHVKTQGNGSGADVAASSFGGMLQYSSFQAEWLRNEFEHAKTLTGLLAKNWTYYSMKPMELPSNVYMCVGWTGKPASTAKLVDKILRLKQDNPTQFQQFLTNSEQAVGNILKGMSEADISLLFKGVKQNRYALATVGENANVAIETPLLSKLCELAELHGGAGKPSGAGGGDCGIAFMPSKEAAEHVMRDWMKADIKPLNIKVSPFGATH